MNFIPLLRHGDFHDFIENTNRVLNEIPLVEKNFIEKLTDRFIYKHAKAIDDGRFEIVVHLPGVGRDNISIEIDDGKREVVVVDRATFVVPDAYSLEVEDIEKTYIDGVLRILISRKKREAAVRRKIIGF